MIIDEAKSSTCDGDQITVAVAVVMLEEVLSVDTVLAAIGCRRGPGGHIVIGRSR